MAKLARWLAVAAVSCLAGGAAAGSDSGSFLLVFASTDGPGVAASLRQHADFVAAQVLVKVDESDPAKRFAAIGAGKARLADEVRKHPGWVLYEGRASLSTVERGKFASSYDSHSGTSVTVLAPLGADTDVYGQSAALVGALAQLEKQSDFEFPVQRIELAVRDPQQYRPQLLKLVAAEAARTRDALAPGGETVLSGLEGPVWVRQVDDRDVELFLDYRLAVRSAGKK
jgi:hypothetical protein